MSLDFNLKKCVQSACWNKDDTMTKRAHDLIWATIVVGLNQITSKNVEEWCWRLNFELRQYGSSSICPSDADSTPFTPGDLEPFIGLHTNASNLTRKQYIKRACEVIVSYHDRAEITRQREYKKFATQP